jgi:transposase InsO family protein
VRVGRSVDIGFHEWRDRPASATGRRRADLAAPIQAIFDDSDGTYGHWRIHAELARADVSCSPELVRRLMRELGLLAPAGIVVVYLVLVDASKRVFFAGPELHLPHEHCRGRPHRVHRRAAQFSVQTSLSG